MEPAGCRGVIGPVPQPLWMSALSTSLVQQPAPKSQRCPSPASITLNIVTVTKQERRAGAPEERCAWCGRRFVLDPGPGRPRRYCKPSHRQRAYEARTTAKRHSLQPGQALMATDRLDAIRDLLYRIEAAMDDVDVDLAEDDSGHTTREALWHLYRACAEVRTISLEPLAVAE
jgi:hypothetical protein